MGDAARPSNGRSASQHTSDREDSVEPLGSLNFDFSESDSDDSSDDLSAIVNESEPSAAPAADLDLSIERDRIVILGRTQAGKTIYLSCLYYSLWRKPKADLTVCAIDGKTHTACIDTINTLSKGEWPASTTGTRFLDLEITHRGKSRPLVSLDYPGEVFRKAFLDQADTPDVQQLLEHIDRAAAVIVLVDPAIASQSDLSVRAEDDFGMFKALERIRTWPGGENVPIAFVLTKFDLRRPLIDAAGGPGAFVKEHYPQIVQLMRRVKVFVVSAVQEQHDGATTRVKDGFRPWGTVEPLNYLLEVLNDREHIEEQEAAKQRMQGEVQRLQERKHREAWQDALRYVFFWGLFIVFLIAAGFVAYNLSTR